MEPHAPLLIIYGDHDGIINLSHAYDVFREAAPPKKLLALKSFGRVLEGLDRLDYLRPITSFLKSLNGF